MGNLGYQALSKNVLKSLARHGIQNWFHVGKAIGSSKPSPNLPWMGSINHQTMGGLLLLALLNVGKGWYWRYWLWDSLVGAGHSDKERQIRNRKFFWGRKCSGRQVLSGNHKWKMDRIGDCDFPNNDPPRRNRDFLLQKNTTARWVKLHFCESEPPFFANYLI